MTDKSDLRRAAKQLRIGFAAEATVDTAFKLSGNFVAGPLAAWDHAKQPAIAGYWPCQTEIDTIPLLQMLVAYGYKVALPVCVTNTLQMNFRRWEPQMDLSLDAVGMQVPPDTSPMLDPDIIMAPCLAFDATGARLGYGKGYYDATLRALRQVKPIVTAVIAYAGQEVTALPFEAMDERANWVVTDTGVRTSGVDTVNN